ncbi:MAG TPA: 16S rRNA (cytidine(1402)-2'-O)-methyltransferase [Gammaproteobacteria bacterium]|nr:16S rRNA (cytidine(1402)-2'-O)-methyltransferase [Gammaproteobacteria bacterium]HIL94983.1 16S rRNA (cytidine(1402)-2'-O)-methyltransferase [Pseudomonadales bacterium]
MSPRALNILRQVDLIAAEDTRHSRKLLRHYLIDTALVTYHDHNESMASDSLVEKLLSGVDIALISDAGTPLISDPGYRLVKQAQERGVRVIPVPGASAIIAALSASGLATDQFRFEGFLPAKTSARVSRLEALKPESCTLVFYEAPHRIEKMIEDLVQVFGPNRVATIARELTKKFEQVVRDDLGGLQARLQGGGIVSKGEFVVLVAGAQRVETDLDETKLMQALLDELPPARAANVAHKLTGSGKKHFYDLALTLKKEKG